MVTIQSQNFGVEIEMTGVSRGTAASVIANYFGVGGIHFAGGTYQTYEAKDSKGRVWKCMRDGSITPRRRRGGAIVEKFGVRRVKTDDIKVVKHGGRYTVTYHKHAAQLH